MISLSQSLSKGLSIGELIPARAVSLHKACSRWLFKLDKCHILWYRSRRFSSSLANSISGETTLKFYEFQNALQEDHYGDDLLTWCKWSLGHIRVFSTGTLPQRLSSLLEGLQRLWEALLPCRCLATWKVIVSCLQHWQCKDCLELFCFEKSLKISRAEEKQSFCIWESDIE